MHPVNILVISVVFICLMVGQGSQAVWPSVIINRINAGRSKRNSSLLAWSGSKCQSIGLWIRMGVCVFVFVHMLVYIWICLYLFISLRAEINQQSIHIWVTQQIHFYWGRYNIDKAEKSGISRYSILYFITNIFAKNLLDLSSKELWLRFVLSCTLYS